VHLYSSGYMAADSALKRYFAMLGFFTFAMLGLVLADNLLLIFVFWELVGFSSYLLIGHWTEQPGVATAATKAFVINRIGDIGFLAGLFIIWSNTGTFSIAELSGGTEIFSWQSSATLCLLWGAIGKSAQFPLFTWLPDAMAGPTPVSALIHAATMVAAGVFLLARTYFLFTPEVLLIVTAVGTVTALAGGLAALGQYDIKKILAYSTISQLGLMVIAIGVGSTNAFMLHLFTHAFFKAGLFLAAGSVIHTLEQARHSTNDTINIQDIRHLGGLKKFLPITFIVFVICGASLAGIPLFSGFLSKEAIISQTLNWAGEDFSWRWIIPGAIFLSSLLTALYVFRLIWYVFIKKNTALQWE
jgi:NADH-quinone oxidoreductase subunit L